MAMVGNKYYEGWLGSVKTLGNKKKIHLLEDFRGIEEIYAASEKRLESISYLNRRNIDAIIGAKKEFIFEKWSALNEEHGASYVSILSKDYPSKLKAIPDPPYAIYVKGEIPNSNSIKVAVIGARECSQYGEYIAKEIGTQLGCYHIEVVSGMARGIDGISQLSAIQSGGKSFGVLGCGVDQCYPRQNEELYQELIKKGGLVSEYPIGTKPIPQLFPPRNRIISGLADVVVVIEAREKSGTFITIDMALEQGKEVYVVPGRMTDSLSKGCNQLIKEGANMIISVDQFIEELGTRNNEYIEGARSDLFLSNRNTFIDEDGEKVKTLTKVFDQEEEKQIYLVLDFESKSIEDIKCELNRNQIILTESVIYNNLVNLLLKDYIKEIGTQMFCIK